MSFQLDPRLLRDSTHVATIGLCTLRLMNDSRWPWLMMIPQRADLAEIFEMTPLDQTMLTFETGLVGAALKKATGATKINTGALGNIVRQLHVHIIARHEGDPNWPGPVWGFETARPWVETEKKKLTAMILEHL